MKCDDVRGRGQTANESNGYVTCSIVGLDLLSGPTLAQVSTERVHRRNLFVRANLRRKGERDEACNSDVSGAKNVACLLDQPGSSPRQDMQRGRHATLARYRDEELPDGNRGSAMALN